MSDAIKHECGLAMIRLLKPLDYYRRVHGDVAWGLRRLYLLMEKQHNRGQDGAGLAVVKFDMPPGEKFMERLRSAKRNPIERLFDEVTEDLNNLSGKEIDSLSEEELKHKVEFLGEVYLGHLRYGTHGGHSQDACHPYVRRNNIASRNLAVAGNFNMTNAGELFEQLVEDGLSPVGDSDTQVVLERIGYSLDREHEHLHAAMGPESLRGLEGRMLAEAISRDLDVGRILKKAAAAWDGGYVIGGLVGNGDAFVCRDPAGIRPAFIYRDDEVVAVASERAALSTVFDVPPERIEAVEPGTALVVKRDGTISRPDFAAKLPIRQCTFERIYFSRGNDCDIYQERKALGHQLAQRVLDAIDGDLERAVFSFIPNTAEIAYLGLTEQIGRLESQRRADRLWQKIEKGEVTRADVNRLLAPKVRREKSAHKDQRLRTFITHDKARRGLVSHVYDITPGSVRPDDTLIVVDDSIVRGTTLRESIITMLSRLNPKRMVVVSSAPPIMYPDCYGIDMSQLGRFIAFEAAISLLMERGDGAILDEIERKCVAQLERPADKMVNYVREIYDRFTIEEISARVAALVRSPQLEWPGRIDVIYQTIDGLHAAMPGHTGDWYFTGNYPTHGGLKVLNTAYLNWRRADDRRPYESARAAPSLIGRAVPADCSQ
jgi:amidophosphoribosyltransferase